MGSNQLRKDGNVLLVSRESEGMILFLLQGIREYDEVYIR